MIIIIINIEKCRTDINDVTSDALAHLAERRHLKTIQYILDQVAQVKRFSRYIHLKLTIKLALIAE